MLARDAKCGWGLIMSLVRKLQPLLRYDRRKVAAGSRGRALTRDVPEVGLLAGDRIEPTERLPDVSLFEQLCPGVLDKAEVTFWRRSEETICLRRSPLWNADVGITPERVVCLDVMHTMHLGCMQDLCMTITMRLINVGTCRGTGATEKETMQAAVRFLKRDLLMWYRVRARLKPKEKLTEVQDFVSAMLGSKSHPAFKLKAGETMGFLYF